MTTDALAGTPLAPVELPPDTTGFGLVEVLYLLARHPGDAVATSRTVLGVPDDALDVQYAMAGRSTLVARGLVAVTAEGTEQSRGAAALLEVALGMTRRWVRVVVEWSEQGGGSDRLVLLEAPDVVGIVQPRALGTFFASFADPAAGSALAAATAIDLSLAEHPSARIAVEVTDSGATRTLFLRRARPEAVGRADGPGAAAPSEGGAAEAWEVVLDEGRPGVDRVARVLDRAGRDAAIADLLPPLGAA